MVSPIAAFSNVLSGNHQPINESVEKLVCPCAMEIKHKLSNTVIKFFKSILLWQHLSKGSFNWG